MQLLPDLLRVGDALLLRLLVPHPDCVPEAHGVLEMVAQGLAVPQLVAVADFVALPLDVPVDDEVEVPESLPVVEPVELLVAEAADEALLVA